jgi:hypothetical protein
VPVNGMIIPTLTTLSALAMRGIVAVAAEKDNPSRQHG